MVQYFLWHSCWLRSSGEERAVSLIFLSVIFFLGLLYSIDSNDS